MQSRGRDDDSLANPRATQTIGAVQETTRTGSVLRQVAHKRPKPRKRPYRTVQDPGPYFNSYTAEDLEWLQRHLFFDFNKMKKRKFWITKKKAVIYLIVAIICALVIVLTVKHTEILNWLQPAIMWLEKETYAGPCIVIAILIIISFPPLFGQEIVGVVAGIIWGLSGGIVVMIIGTTIGEAANYLVFRRAFDKASSEQELKSNNYGCLAAVLKGGRRFHQLTVSVLIRLSIIPGHVSTTMFAACKLDFWIFLVAALLSTPKLLVPVFAGVQLEQANSRTNSSQSEEAENSSADRIENVALIAFSLMSFIAVGIIFQLMHKWKYDFLEEKYAKLESLGQLPPARDLREISDGRQTDRSESQGIQMKPVGSDKRVDQSGLRYNT